jgi:preprotein translocase subunit SecD
VAPPAGTLRVSRYFLALLAIVAVLYMIVFWPGARHTPKLGLDLEGGTQVIFTAKAPGGKTPSSSSMQQAKEIMEERVNGSGVTEATVVIQGSDQIVISIPGSNDTDVSKLGAAAVLNLRGLVTAAVPVTCTPLPTSGSSSSTSPSTSPSPSGSSSPAGAQPNPTDSGADAGHRALNPQANRNAPTTTPASTPTTAPSSTPTPTGSGSSSAAAAPTCSATPFAALEKSGVTIPTSETAFDKLSSTQQAAVSAALADFDCRSAQNEPDIKDKYFLACDPSGNAYLLGTVIVPGHEISTASAVAPNVSNGQTDWTVALDMKTSGQAAWGKYTSAHNIGGADSGGASSTACGTAAGIPCADFVGFTLDGVVISAPVNINAINGGQTQIQGSFTPSSARDLANKLKFGALPLSFKADQQQTVSATLGTSQLKAGFLAGGIGLILVVIYSLLYYRALGLVTIASLIVSGILTYGCLVMLGTQIGFTLSLAGIAGFIVAVGITADSFVVFFERIKDEVHEGRTMRVAIPRAWTRARRTILSADTVSFLAAAILYYFAAGDVKGFAFTLGLSTVLDLAVVFLFTHPLVSWLSRSKAFGSARFTGLNAVREGGVAISDEPVRKGARPDPAPPSGRGKVAISKSSVAVLDSEEDEVPAEPATDAVDATATAPDGATAAPAGSQADEPVPSDEAVTSDEPAPAPGGGTAAERAAARRARLREKGGK